jgi:phenylacetyl-CoA:acceptor oxidoreductase subunit 2
MKGWNRADIGSKPWLQNFWDMRAACNFMGGGAGTGLVVASAVYALLGRDYMLPMLLGLVLVGFGLMMVWLEIGKPWRALHVFFHPQTSWMTREGLVAPFLYGFAGLSLLFYQSTWGGLSAALAALSALIYLYCQSQMLFASKGIPTWRHPALTPYILATGLVEGFGIACCFLASVTFDVEAGLVLLIIARYFAWRRYVSALKRDGAPSKSIKVINAFNLKFLLIGNLLPVVLLMSSWLTASLHSTLLIAGALIAAAAGSLSKIVIVTRAAHTQGFSIPMTPKRGRGDSKDAKSPGWSGGPRGEPGA